MNLISNDFLQHERELLHFTDDEQFFEEYKSLSMVQKELLEQMLIERFNKYFDGNPKIV